MAVALEVANMKKRVAQANHLISCPRSKFPPLGLGRYHFTTSPLHPRTPPHYLFFHQLLLNKVPRILYLR